MKRPRVLLALLHALILSQPAFAQDYPKNLIVKFLDDGRKMELVEPFVFIDSEKRTWKVPEKWVVDGASIPQPLWSVVGGPFSGKYRNASVIHDYFCDVRRRPWDQVHNVFYEAMLASGVNGFRAKMMYLAVYRFGPRWNYPAKGTCPPTMSCIVDPFVFIDEYQPAFDQQEYEAMEKALKSDPGAPVSRFLPDLDRSFVEDYLTQARPRPRHRGTPDEPREDISKRLRHLFGN